MASTCGHKFLKGGFLLRGNGILRPAATKVCNNHIPAASSGSIGLTWHLRSGKGSPLLRYRGLLKHPATIAIAYVALSLAWIFLTDLAVEHATLTSAGAAAISIAK